MIEILGAVDTDPSLVGKDLGVVCGIEPLGVRVAGRLDEALAATEAGGVFVDRSERRTSRSTPRSSLQPPALPLCLMAFPVRSIQ